MTPVILTPSPLWGIIKFIFLQIFVLFGCIYYLSGQEKITFLSGFFLVAFFLVSFTFLPYFTQKHAFLKIAPEGITEKNYQKEFSYKWSDIEDIKMVTTGYLTKSVGLKVKHPQSGSILPYQRWFINAKKYDVNVILASNYGKSPEELVAILKDSASRHTSTPR